VPLELKSDMKDDLKPLPERLSMRINSKDFYVKEGKKVDLKEWPTLINPYYKSDDECRKLLEKHIQQMALLQDIFYAYNRYSLLLIFQAMDAAGKDSAIKHVMSGVNPQGCQVFSFKHPSAEEMEHDYLWRTTRCLPERGRIGIFNRSYYEEVLVARVHPEILKAQEIPSELIAKKDLWQERFHSIREFEKHMYRNGTRIIKFFLHLSKEEQRKRFLRRIDNPAKNWKFSPYDMQERGLWKSHMKAYEDAISATSQNIAPWYIVPADDKENARLIISQTILDTFESLKISYPKMDAKHLKDLQSIRKQLTAKTK
jgi:PPK2 family polyphosphate:nucleotide phosphotransferase